MSVRFVSSCVLTLAISRSLLWTERGSQTSKDSGLGLRVNAGREKITQSFRSVAPHISSNYLRKSLTLHFAVDWEHILQVDGGWAPSGVGDECTFAQWAGRNMQCAWRQPSVLADRKPSTLFWAPVSKWGNILTCFTNTNCLSRAGAVRRRNVMSQQCSHNTYPVASCW